MKKNISQKYRQKGVTIYIVIIMMLLSMLLALWTSRTALFSEMVTGNDADYQRAFEAAQTMLQDAQEDIYRNLHGKNLSIIRTGNITALPANQSSFIEWSSQMPTNPPHCNHGVCLRITGAENFWDDENAFESMMQVGTRYGAYSGATIANDANPILLSSKHRQGAWYWIEPIQFRGSEIGDKQALLDDSISPPVQTDMVFRVTAIALGLKGAVENNNGDITERSKTMAVIQSVIALPPNSGE